MGHQIVHFDKLPPPHPWGLTSFADIDAIAKKHFTELNPGFIANSFIHFISEESAHRNA